MVHDPHLPAADDEGLEIEAVRAERDALRARLERLEHERAEEMRRAAAVVADAQRRLYWLDRLHIDPDVVMAGPIGSAVRGLIWVRRKVRG